MDVKFFANGKVLDFKGQKLSIQENNSMVSDNVFTKYVFPFDFYIDEDFIGFFGDVGSPEFELENSVFNGFFTINGKLHEATLTLMEIQGEKATLQLDYGFEELPNWQKKLAELPLENFAVPDIHTFAPEIIKKKWPQTNFNFPRIYTKFYSPDSKIWDAFNGYYNDLNDAGTEMIRNNVDTNGDIYNRNIIHPCPHILYLLKVGFLDAGYSLGGDILQDPLLQNAWVFSGTEYFEKVAQFNNAFMVSASEYKESKWEFWKFGANHSSDYQVRYTYYEDVHLDFNDQVFINGKFRTKVWYQGYVKLSIYLNGQIIWSKERYTGRNNEDITEPFSFNLNVNNATITFRAEGFIIASSDYNIFEYSLKSNSIIAQGQAQSDDDATVLNPNKIDLKKAVPDMTFGDFVNVVRAWFNYDLDIVENKAVMTMLGKNEPSDFKDFRFAEVKEPKWKFLQNRTFLFRFAKIDGYEQNSVFYGKDGVTINKEPEKETTVTEINGYVLPLEKAKAIAPLTAALKNEATDTLALVYYSGPSGTQNNATPEPGATFPKLFYSNFIKFYKLRLKGKEFNWKYFVPADLHNLKVKDFIFAYKKIHLIKNITMDLQDNNYEVDITSESIY